MWCPQSVETPTSTHWTTSRRLSSQPRPAFQETTFTPWQCQTLYLIKFLLKDFKWKMLKDCLYLLDLAWSNYPVSEAQERTGRPTNCHTRETRCHSWMYTQEFGQSPPFFLWKTCRVSSTTLSRFHSRACWNALRGLIFEYVVENVLGYFTFLPLVARVCGFGNIRSVSKFFE